MLFSPLMRYDRDKAAYTTPKPESQQPYKKGVLQLISYSLLCKWFQTAVLPLDKLLYAELFKTEDKKRCTECGASFASTSNSVKYCPDCRKRITRRQAAERMRKRRALVT